MGVYLVWKNPSDDMKVYVDFSITLLNRVHFSQNQNYSAKAVKFTSDAKGKIIQNLLHISYHLTFEQNYCQLILPSERIPITVGWN